MCNTCNINFIYSLDEQLINVKADNCNNIINFKREHNIISKIKGVLSVIVLNFRGD